MKLQTVKLSFPKIPGRFTRVLEISHLFHLSQVHIDIITGVIGVPLLLVPLHFRFQESYDLTVVGMDGLVRSWQVVQQAREGIVQLWMGHTVRSVIVLSMFCDINVIAEVDE